jgi:hypothetical protein
VAATIRHALAAMACRTVAQNMMSAACVVGTTVLAWAAMAFRSIRLSLREQAFDRRRLIIAGLLGTRAEYAVAAMPPAEAATVRSIVANFSTSVAGAATSKTPLRLQTAALGLQIGTHEPQLTTAHSAAKFVHLELSLIHVETACRSVLALTCAILIAWDATRLLVYFLTKMARSKARARSWTDVAYVEATIVRVSTAKAW